MTNAAVSRLRIPRPSLLTGAASSSAKMLEVLRQARVSDDTELAAARAEHDRAWKAHVEAAGSIRNPEYQAVRAANDRIGAALLRLMNG